MCLRSAVTKWMYPLTVMGRNFLKDHNHHQMFLFILQLTEMLTFHLIVVYQTNYQQDMIYYINLRFRSSPK